MIMDDETKRRILDEAHANVDRRDKQHEQEAILRAELSRPLADFRDRGQPPPRLKNYRPKIDTPHLHPAIGIFELDARIERALAGEREESAAVLQQALTAMVELVDGMDNVLSKVCKQISDLGCEIAELRAERARTVGGDVVPLPQRRQAH
jgi:hypothetical protein